MTVYIIQAPSTGGYRNATYDTTPAAQYGQIRYIFESGYTPSVDAARAVDIASKALVGFNCEEDYLVWAGGDPASMIICAVVAYDYSQSGDIKFLKWENSRDPISGRKTGAGHYVPVTLPFSEGAQQ